jgi:hypothetical protein
MMHWLHLCSGCDSVVQAPQGGLYGILEVLVFTCFEGEIREEENEPWKKPEAQIRC